MALHKKWSFLLRRISSVNVTKSAANCGFGHIDWRNPLWKTSFFVQCVSYFLTSGLFKLNSHQWDNSYRSEMTPNSWAIKYCAQNVSLSDNVQIQDFLLIHFFYKMDTEDLELAVTAVILLRRVRKRKLKCPVLARKTQIVVNSSL